MHTTSNREIVGPGWNVRTAVQEYGGAAAIVHDGVAYFSHMVDGRVYRVEVKEGSEPESITPGGYNHASILETHLSMAKKTSLIGMPHSNHIPNNQTSWCRFSKTTPTMCLLRSPRR